MVQIGKLDNIKFLLACQAARVDRTEPGGHKRMMRDKRNLVIASFIVALLLTLAAFWFVGRSPPSPWVPTTHPYSADCAEQCENFGAPKLTHGGAVELLYDPKVDDPVAQWADCLQSAMVCLEATDKPISELIDGCVAAAACPQSCKQTYAEQAAKLVAGEALRLALFDELFVAKGGLCVADDEQ